MSELRGSIGHRFARAVDFLDAELGRRPQRLISCRGQIQHQAHSISILDDPGLLRYVLDQRTSGCRQLAERAKPA